MTNEQTNTQKIKRERSPSFPIISLPDAIKRLQAFEQTFGRHPAPGIRVGLAWGMKNKSSQAYQILAALKAYGLVQYEGSGEQLQASLTEEARTYLRARQDSIKTETIKQIALMPAQFQKFWSIWGADRPPEEICLDQLILQHSFTDKAAHNFLKVYDETIAYAGLSNSDTVIEGDDADELPFDFKSGDFINWLSNEQVQWVSPRRIISIDKQDDQYFYKVEDNGGQIGWIPVEQAIQHESENISNKATVLNPPPAEQKKQEILAAGSRKAVFPIDEGDVTLIFPENITSDGLEELGLYLNIFLKKEQKRREKND